jgi:hypothetical protein
MRGAGEIRRPLGLGQAPLQALRTLAPTTWAWGAEARLVHACLRLRRLVPAANSPATALRSRPAMQAASAGRRDKWAHAVHPSRQQPKQHRSHRIVPAANRPSTKQSRQPCRPVHPQAADQRIAGEAKRSQQGNCRAGTREATSHPTNPTIDRFRQTRPAPPPKQSCTGSQQLPPHIVVMSGYAHPVLVASFDTGVRQRPRGYPARAARAEAAGRWPVPTTAPPAGPADEGEIRADPGRHAAPVAAHRPPRPAQLDSPPSGPVTVEVLLKAKAFA